MEKGRPGSSVQGPDANCLKDTAMEPQIRAPSATQWPLGRLHEKRAGEKRVENVVGGVKEEAWTLPSLPPSQLRNPFQSDAPKHLPDAAGALSLVRSQPVL